LEVKSWKFFKTANAHQRQSLSFIIPAKAGIQERLKPLNNPLLNLQLLNFSTSQLFNFLTF